jgi:hypothetical protein
VRTLEKITSRCVSKKIGAVPSRNVFPTIRKIKTTKKTEKRGRTEDRVVQHGLLRLPVGFTDGPSRTPSRTQIKRRRSSTREPSYMIASESFRTIKLENEATAGNRLADHRYKEHGTRGECELKPNERDAMGL